MQPKEQSCSIKTSIRFAYVGQMSTTGVQEISRFHAIVAAKPLHGFGPPVIERHIPHEPWSVRFHTGKRKRDTPGVVAITNKAVKRDHERNSTREVSKDFRTAVINLILRFFSMSLRNHIMTERSYYAL